MRALSASSMSRSWLLRHTCMAANTVQHTAAGVHVATGCYLVVLYLIMGQKKDTDKPGPAAAAD
jgi:hypothetical protein